MPPQDPIPEFDVYAVLGVSRDADQRTIEQAWRARVRSVHPDRAGDGDERAATERTARLNIAREWLMDPSRRARYDLLRPPRPMVEIPDVDPLGSWPVRRSSRRRYGWSFLEQMPVLVALSIVAVTVIVGIGSNVVTIVAFDLSIVTLAYYGVFALIGALFRRRNG